MIPRAIPSLWLCADVAAVATPDALVARVTAALGAGPAVVWLRPAPTTPPRELAALARVLAPVARAAGGALLVGDRVDVALVSGADGVHLTSGSVTPADARRLWTGTATDGRAPAFVSVAVHDATAVDAATPEADALVLSPLGVVPDKAAALGVAGFAALAARAPARPFVALGGIVDAASAASAARAGATAIAVRRALVASDDPAAECRALREAFLAARAGGRNA